ncbi:copper-binding transcription factor [Umbelopsis sp. WA50703]
MEHTAQCTCKKAKKKPSLRRPGNNPSLMAIDVSHSAPSSRGTPSPPTSASPYLHEPNPWSWALIAPKQDNIDSDSRHNHISTNENGDYSFVFHKSADAKNQKQRRRSSLSSRSSLIHTSICTHQLARASSSDSSVKSEPVLLSDNDGNSFALFPGSPDDHSQNPLSNSDPLGSKAIFPSDLDSEAANAAGSLEFSFDLSNDLAMLIDEKQPTPGEAEDLANFPVSSTSSVSGEFTDELTNTLTFDSAAELMAIFDTDLSQPLPPMQQPPPQRPKHTRHRPTNQSCCGSFAPSSACCNDSSLPGESVCISITPVGGAVSNQQQPTTRIVTCRCGSGCTCPGCLVHAGASWLTDPYAGVPSSSCSSDDEDLAMMDEGPSKPALQWLNNATPEPM